MRTFLALMLAPAAALAQSSYPTDFPSGAEPLTQEALKHRLTGKTFVAKPTVGDEVRTEYQDTFAYINVGGTSDSGKWRIEGSSICVEWRKIRPSCSEMRLAGDVLFVKRANNGEVMALVPK